jgi:hypothetical protein
MGNEFCQRLRGNREAVEVKNMRLTSLYLRNLGPILLGFAIVGLLNLVTPLESLRIKAAENMAYLGLRNTFLGWKLVF